MKEQSRNEAWESSQVCYDLPEPWARMKVQTFLHPLLEEEVAALLRRKKHGRRERVSPIDPPSESPSKAGPWQGAPVFDAEGDDHRAQATGARLGRALRGQDSTAGWVEDEVQLAMVRPTRQSSGAQGRQSCACPGAPSMDTTATDAETSLSTGPGWHGVFRVTSNRRTAGVERAWPNAAVRSACRRIGVAEQRGAGCFPKCSSCDSPSKASPGRGAGSPAGPRHAHGVHAACAVDCRRMRLPCSCRPRDGRNHPRRCGSRAPKVSSARGWRAYRIGRDPSVWTFMKARASRLGTAGTNVAGRTPAA